MSAMFLHVDGHKQELSPVDGAMPPLPCHTQQGKTGWDSCGPHLVLEDLAWPSFVCLLVTSEHGESDTGKSETEGSVCTSFDLSESQPCCGIFRYRDHSTRFKLDRSRSRVQVVQGCFRMRLNRESSVTKRVNWAVWMDGTKNRWILVAARCRVWFVREKRAVGKEFR